MLPTISRDTSILTKQGFINAWGGDVFVAWIGLVLCFRGGFETLYTNYMKGPSSGSPKNQHMGSWLLKWDPPKMDLGVPFDFPLKEKR